MTENFISLVLTQLRSTIFHLDRILQLSQKEEEEEEEEEEEGMSRV